MLQVTTAMMKIASVLCLAMVGTACITNSSDACVCTSLPSHSKNAKIVEMLGRKENIELSSPGLKKMVEEVISERNYIEIGLDLLQEELFIIEYDNYKMVWYSTHVLIYEKNTGIAIGESQSPTFRKLLKQHKKANLVAKYATGTKPISQEEKAELRELLWSVFQIED